MFFILELPIFLVKLISQEVKQGEKVIFQVKVDGYPLLNIIWLLNGKVLTSESNVRIETDQNTGDSELSIDKVGLEQHVGIVTCRIENIHGRAEEITRLDIRAAPMIKTQLQTKEEVASGKDITLKVVAIGSPQPQAQWYYNDKALEASNVAYDELKDEYRLTIEKASSTNNDGRYRVVLKNELGECESTACVLCVPEPVKLIRVSPTLGVVNVKVGETLELCFDIDGNETPKVQFNKNSKIMKFTSVNEGRHVYKVDAAKPQDQGVYKVIAKNKISIEGTTIYVNVDDEHTISRVKEELNKVSFAINPPSECVELFAKKVNTEGADSCLLSNHEGVIGLDSLEAGSFEVEVYSMSTDPPLLLERLQITKTNDGVDVRSVDLNATALHTNFAQNDMAVTEAMLSGKFTDRNGHTYDLYGRTNNRGEIKLVLPEGIIENMVAKKADIAVRKIGKITMPSPAQTLVNIPRKPKRLMLDCNASSFDSVVAPENPDSRVIVLGDVSGSMAVGNQMDILRCSFLEIFKKCLQNNWKVSMASWHTSADWCTQTWITSDQNEMVKAWINGRRAGGGTSLLSPLSDSMLRYPDATDVYVMCDGDMTPFDTNQGMIDWKQFREKFPTAKFHFIALGVTASHESMEAMAEVGDGIFNEVT